MQSRSPWASGDGDGFRGLDQTHEEVHGKDCNATEEAEEPEHHEHNVKYIRFCQSFTHNVSTQRLFSRFGELLADTVQKIVGTIKCVGYGLLQHNSAVLSRLRGFGDHMHSVGTDLLGNT